MIIVKKWIVNIMIIITFIITIGCIVGIYRGSLEMFPTEEQIAKVRLVYSIFTTIFFIIDIVIIVLRLKLVKTNDEIK